MGRQLPEAAFEDLPWSGDPWRLVADAAALERPQAAPVLALGNGFIGVRGPGSDEPAVYLNGVHEKMPIAYHEAAHGYARESDTRLPVADCTALAITVDGATLDDAWDKVTLDMAAGLLRCERRLASGVAVTLERLVAMERNVVATRVTVIAAGDAPCSVSVVATPTSPYRPAEPTSDGLYDPRVGPSFATSPWLMETSETGWRVDRFRRSGQAVGVAVTADRTAAALKSGECVTFDNFGAYVAGPGAVDPRPLAAAALADGFDALAAAQRAWFDAFWADAHISFPDHPRAEQALRHGLFQLVQAVGRDGKTSIAAKGQTGEGYEGHVFWDADSYVFPLFLHTCPAIARAMLAWRVALLDEARANARAMGQAKGALYPWRTIAGRECSSFFPAGSAQYHINADIAHALRCYVAATGDRSILDEGGAEMLAETARIWLQIGFHDPARDDAFVINRVTGPDEYSALVDNNLYTNLLAAEHLRFAADTGAAFLDPGETKAMRRAADAMMLPHDAERDIPAQDERFFALEPWPFAATPASDYPLLIHYHPLTIYRHRVAKQADAVLAAVLHRDRFDAATRRRMLDEYEAVTVHDSTLSASAFAAAAANIGDADRAWHYWRASVLTDLGNLFANSDHGLHMAALAGGWTALTAGFAGMRSDDGLSFDPITLPALGRYAFRVNYLGRKVLIEVGATEAQYTLEGGEPLTFRHRGETITLGHGSVTRPL